jgi:hypothetical protein
MNKKIVMVKLIIQKKIGTVTTESSVCLVKVLDLYLWCLILVLVLGILDSVGKCADPRVGQFWVETAGGIFTSFVLPTFLGLWAIHCKWEP